MWALGWRADHGELGAGPRTRGGEGGAGAARGSAALLNLPSARRFLLEGLGEMRSSAGRRGQRSVSGRGKIRAYAQILI